MSKKQKVIITGAAGFLGSHLCDRFLSEGYNVTGMDNLSTGSLKNIEHISDINFDFIEMDVTEPLRVLGKVDYILHFASPASPIDYLKMPIETLRVGSVGTYNCLELARLTGAKIIVASTSEIYGDPIEHPQKETYWGNVNSIGVRGVYDEAKRYLEAITMAYHRYNRVDTKIVRIFNTYGSRMRANDGRAIPSFFSKAMNNEDVEVFGDGSQTRSLTYVDDTVEGIFRLILSGYNLPVNIGNPDEITVKELAKEIISLTNSPSKIVHRNLPQDDPRQRCPDISIAKKVLNWQPEIHRSVGLKRTYEYLKSITI